MILPETITHRILQNTATQNKTSTKMIFLPFTLGPSYMWSRLWDKYRRVWVLRAGTSWDPFSSWVPTISGKFIFGNNCYFDQVCPPFLRFYVQPSLRHKYLESIKAALRHFMTLEPTLTQLQKGPFYILFEVDRHFRMLVYFGNKFYVNYMVHNVFSKQITSMWIIANTSKIENYTLAMSFNVWLP